MNIDWPHRRIIAGYSFSSPDLGKEKKPFRPNRSLHGSQDIIRAHHGRNSPAPCTLNPCPAPWFLHWDELIDSESSVGVLPGNSKILRFRPAPTYSRQQNLVLIYKGPDVTHWRQLSLAIFNWTTSSAF